MEAGISQELIVFCVFFQIRFVTRYLINFKIFEKNEVIWDKYGGKSIILIY